MHHFIFSTDIFSSNFDIFEFIISGNWWTWAHDKGINALSQSELILPFAKVGFLFRLVSLRHFSTSLPFHCSAFGTFSLPFFPALLFFSYLCYSLSHTHTFACSVFIFLSFSFLLFAVLSFHSFHFVLFYAANGHVLFLVHQGKQTKRNSRTM